MPLCKKFIEQLCQAQHYDAAFKAYSDYIIDLNFHSLSYVFMPINLFGTYKEQMPRFSVTDNFSKSFLEEYAISGFQSYDYIVDAVSSGQQNCLYLWEDDRKSGQLNKQASYEVEKLQEKHDNEIEKLEHRSAVLNNSVDSLQQTLKRNRSDFRDTFAGIKDNQHPSNAESLFISTSESFGECVKEYSTMAKESDKLQVSINTLQESWEAVRKQYNGDKENVSTQP